MALLPGSETPGALSQHGSLQMPPLQVYKAASLTSGSGWLVGDHKLWLCDSGVYGESYPLGSLRKTTHTTEDDLGGSKDLLNSISETTTVIKKNLFFFSISKQLYRGLEN